MKNITIVGVGKSGGRVVSKIQDVEKRGVNLLAIDYDRNDLAQVFNTQKVIVSRESVEISRNEIRSFLYGSDEVFVIVGLGGKYGTSVSSTVASAAKECGAKVTFIVTTPFMFEGREKYDIAQKRLAELETEYEVIEFSCDSLVNSKDTAVSIVDGFKKVDIILSQIILSKVFQ